MGAHEQGMTADVALAKAHVLGPLCARAKAVWRADGAPRSYLRRDDVGGGVTVAAAEAARADGSGGAATKHLT